jgi:hypothetical protein
LGFCRFLTQNDWNVLGKLGIPMVQHAWA